MTKVFINPGHCPGTDPGAVNEDWNMDEAETVLAIGSLVQHYLNAAGVETVLMQSNNLCGEDGQGYYDSVCYHANRVEYPDYFISLHCNAYNRNAKGTETYYASYTGQQLATCIQAQLVDELGTLNRGVKRNGNLMVIKNTTMPAVLVEIAFIDNQDDCALLCFRQDDIARAIARGVTDFLSIQNKTMQFLDS